MWADRFYLEVLTINLIGESGQHAPRVHRRVARLRQNRFNHTPNWVIEYADVAV